MARVIPLRLLLLPCWLGAAAGWLAWAPMSGMLTMPDEHFFGGPMDYVVMLRTAVCEPCDILAPHLEDLQRTLNGEGLPVHFSALDVERYPEFPARYGIDDHSPGRPTILLFERRASPHPGTPLAFGGTNLPDLAKWIREVLRLPSETPHRADDAPAPRGRPVRGVRRPAAPSLPGEDVCGAGDVGLLIGGQLSHVAADAAEEQESAVVEWVGARWARFGSGLAGRADVLLRNGSCVYAAGVLSVTVDDGRGAEVPTEMAPRVAMWTPRARTWRALDADGALYPAGGPIAALATDGVALYAGGAFVLGDGARGGRYMATWGARGWAPLPAGPDAPVSTLAYDARHGLLYACGSFLRLGGAEAPQGIGVWDGARWLVPTPMRSALPPAPVVGAAGVAGAADPQVERLVDVAVGGGTLHALGSEGGIFVMRNVDAGDEAMGADDVRWWRAPELPSPLLRPSALAWAEVPRSGGAEVPIGAGAGGALYVASDFVRYDHGELACIARLDGDTWTVQQ